MSDFSRMERIASAPVAAPPEVRAEVAQSGPSGLGPPPRRSYGLLVGGTLAIIVLFLVAAVVSVYLVAGLGVGAFAIAGILALVPLAIVLIGVRWIDLWEPEPRGALLFAFLWGAGVSVLIALIVGAEIENLVYAAGGPGPGYEFLSATIQAPIVEETGKGLAVLLLFWFARRHFDGPVDGLVYAATAAGGFAFTENILYFGGAVVEGEQVGGILELFLIRGLMSPFAHVMFTAWVGVLLGLAARRSSPIAGIPYFLVGLIPAVLLHALWNGALFFVVDFYLYYAIVQVPLFATSVLIVVYLRRKEAEITRDRLAEYASAGWFNPDEVGALATGQGRRVAMVWARQRGLAPAMRSYTRDAARLAFTRQRLISGRSNAKTRDDERLLLTSIARLRRSLQGGNT